ncbi:hypothetical protein COOONC_18302 [Cooperia oncophora]
MLRCRCLFVRPQRAWLSSLPTSSSEGQKATNIKPEEAELDPVKSFTMFGNPKRSVFHYTDRKSGTGYSDFSTTVYQHRPYIWPPLRKLFNFNFMLACTGLMLLSLDYEWIIEQFNSSAKGLKPQASQFKEEEHDVYSESTNPVP